MNNKWTDWQKQVIQEEYVEPELDEEKLKKKMDEINRKYYTFHSHTNRNTKMKIPT
ncbi:hypothetical protein JCM9140_2704 [Halalkalibacter wakoensis JCM 9140]|uniref:Uncharacterized protein n=1 Tax=Halalkalibacter wakoensis JCM 9140 TaxID=1236970 RepID=W4Q3U4_9BACI|nr:hypothetical protein [Halalkalibacter wakoensis]GAE26620.1 hypothetical protein JCM9140_2704 [Halalkalibacter wakoensis JCM 9140]